MHEGMAASPHRARWIPVGVAALVVAVGLLLVLNADRSGPKTNAPPPPPTSSAPSPTASLASTAATDTSAPLASYRPVLGEGPDIGRLLIADASAGHVLVVLQDQLVWLSSERAQVMAAPIAGGQPQVLFSSDDESDFGGALVAAPSKQRVYWLIERVGSEQEPIYQAQFLDGKWSKPSLVAQGGSPAALSAADDALYWSDLGNIMRWSPETKRTDQLHERGRRIASMTASKTTLFWIEVSYEPTSAKPPSLLRWSPERGPSALSTLPAQAGKHLQVLGEQLLWTEEGAGTSGRIVAVSRRKGGKPTSLVVTGPVAAMTHDASTLYWVESYDGSDAGVVSILRKRLLASGAVYRMGRIAGSVSSLSAADGYLYWLGDGGVRRLALEP